MSIPTVHPLSVAPADIGAITGSNAAPAISDVPASGASTNLATDAHASIVDISNLGEVLSASANLQLATPAFTDVAATAQAFVDALNNSQSSVIPDQLPLIAETAFPGTSSANLAALGFEQQDNAESGNVQFALNLQSLQATFQANPAQTAALLAQTIQTLGTSATKVAGQSQTAQANSTANSLPVSGAKTANADAQLQLQQSLTNLALEQAFAANSSTSAAKPATTATPVPAVDNATSENTNVTVPANIPPAPLNNAAELASDPSVAAAVAAYRLGIRTTSRSSRTPDDAVTAVAAVPRIEPVALNVHQK